MRLLFLDFDGVIVTAATQFVALDRACVARLDALCRDTGARVVISSTWRYRGLPACRKLLRAAGFTGPVIGTTPALFGPERGEEIRAWLDRRRAGQSDTVVILDDDTDMGELLPRLVRTQSRAGLTEADVNRARTLFGCPATR